MKKFIPLLLLLLPLSIFAQDTTAFKGAKQIVVKTDLPAAEGYKQVVMALLDAGYFLDQKDESLFIATTQPKRTSKGSYNHILNIRAKENEVIVSGRFKSGVEVSFMGARSVDDYEDIVFRGVNGSMYKITFNEMAAFASSLQKPLIYTK